MPFTCPCADFCYKLFALFLIHAKSYAFHVKGKRNSNVAPDHAIKAYKENRSITPLILNLVSVNITPPPLYSRERTTVPTE
jgi:hypothetical protein